MSQPLSESDILFPHLSNNPNLSSTLSSLKRSTLSIHNRLSSIISDSEFVSSVASAYNLPLVANERCGSWYIPPEKKSEGVYFKSTDGHMGQWGFSLRRLNLQLLDVVEKWGGAVIVDSTRRGKSMPDALCKTVPIWCCVINRALFDEFAKYELFTPPQVVSESEHAQIESRIDGFVRQFLDICKPMIPTLRSKLQKPLRPIWVTQQSSLPDTPPSFPEFHPIVLCTASHRVHGAEASEGGYIQGAADDHEAWSHGLNPTIFWKHKDLLINVNEEDALGLVVRLLNGDSKRRNEMNVTLIKPTTTVHISSTQNINLQEFDVLITCARDCPSSEGANAIKNARGNRHLNFSCQTGKLGSRDLRNQLWMLPLFLEKLPSTSPKILVCCPTGKDLAVGTALAILCLYADDDGAVDLGKRRGAGAIDKGFIKQRLTWITTSNPALNPSRATLQSVNAVLLESQDPKALKTAQPCQQDRPIRTKMESSATGHPAPPNHNTPDETEQKHIPSNYPNPPPSIPTTIFNNLLTSPFQSWAFHRTLRSTLPTHPSGTVTGTATFNSCNLLSASPPTLLYAEEGDFVTDTGLRFTARRKYVYQLRTQPKDGKTYIVVRFFDDEKLPRAKIEHGIGKNGEGVGGLFVEMDTLTSTDDETWEAKNIEQHLCAEDLYTASWKFSEGITKEGRGESDMWWEVRYDVKGPKKDYVSVTRYERR